jgi:hypothetical protein
MIDDIVVVVVVVVVLGDDEGDAEVMMRQSTFTVPEDVFPRKQ